MGRSRLRVDRSSESRFSQMSRRKSLRCPRPPETFLSSACRSLGRLLLLLPKRRSEDGWTQWANKLHYLNPVLLGVKTNGARGRARARHSEIAPPGLGKRDKPNETMSLPPTHGELTDLAARARAHPPGEQLRSSPSDAEAQTGARYQFTVNMYKYCTQKAQRQTTRTVTESCEGRFC